MKLPRARSAHLWSPGGVGHSELKKLPRVCGSLANEPQVLPTLLPGPPQNLLSAPLTPARPPRKRELYMGQRSTDTRVSHHTGYLGTDKDTPQEMHLSEEKCTPDNKDNSSREREQKTISFHCDHTTEKKYLLFFAKNVRRPNLCFPFFKKKHVA